MTRDQLASAAAQGAKLVWSPQSNLRLYSQTTQVGDALDVGLPVALGADWLPSGSTSLLAEMKVARQELTNQNHPISAKELVAMVSSTAADIAGLGDKIGTLDVGRPADVLVLAQRDDDLYESSASPTQTTSSSCSSAETSPTAAWTGSPLSPGTRQTFGWNQSSRGADPCCSTPATSDSPVETSRPCCNS
jgi:cytosine/adenosine deaminase-related metal-dependent hydrolase